MSLVRQRSFNRVLIAIAIVCLILSADKYGAENLLYLGAGVMCVLVWAALATWISVVEAQRTER